jgi:thiol-disulfide isomerase/thioredoxin
MRHCHALRCSWLAATPSSSSSSSPMQAMMMCAPRTAIRKFRPSLHARPGRVEAAAAAVRRVPFVASSGSGVPRVGPGAQQCRALSSSGPTISAGPPGAAPEATPRDDIVFDVDDETFMPKVLGPPPAGKERVPVIVQCTAEWCGPCKELSPVLEAVVRSYNGGVQLAVLDIDKAQGVAAQMRVQSVPFVLGFKPGKQPDGQEGMTVAGAFPGGDEAAMREWITDVLGAAPVEVAATPQSLLGDGAEFLDGGGASTHWPATATAPKHMSPHYISYHRI